MSFQPAPNMASIAIHATNNGKQIANVLHAAFHEYPGQSVITALATDIAGVVVGAYEPLMSANLILTDITVTGLTFINDYQDTITAGSSPGTASGDPLPANNTLVCTLRSALTGRSARGRIYTFPTGATNIAAGGGDLYDTAYATAVQSFWSDVIDQIGSSGWTASILSRFTGGVKRTEGAGFAITNVEVRNSVADSQRRRLPKGH